MRAAPEHAQGYAPTNLLASLRALRGNLRGLDFSNLTLRGVYLQDVEMQDAGLARTALRDSNFTQTFEAINSVAISPNGVYCAIVSRRGEMQLWEMNGFSLLRQWRAYIDMVWSLTFSHDGRRLASGSWDDTFKV